MRISNNNQHLQKAKLLLWGPSFLGKAGKGWERAFTSQK